MCVVSVRFVPSEFIALFGTEHGEFGGEISMSIAYGQHPGTKKKTLWRYMSVQLTFEWVSKPNAYRTVF